MSTFSTPEAISAVLDIPAGNVQLVAADRVETVVQVAPSDPSKSRDVKAAEAAEVEYGDGVLRIGVAAKNNYFGPTGSVAVVVQLPAGSELSLQAASVEFRSTGSLGAVVISSAHGSIELEDAATAKLSLTAGDVSVGRLHGSAEIRTSKGDIRIAEAVSGALDLRTEVGEINVVAAAGVSATLDAGTTTGRINNELKNAEGAGAGLTIHATSTVGDIVARSL
jgi:DUF4097 and DUF4098 domain-containing protein YvlB